MTVRNKFKAVTAKLWHELEPILIHAVVVLVILSVLTICSYMLAFMKQNLPHKAAFLGYIETLESYAAFVLMAEYTIYAVLLIGRLLYCNLKVAFGFSVASATMPIKE